jgi:two-component system chemotaxis response regulator CheY
MMHQAFPGAVLVLASLACHAIALATAGHCSVFTDHFVSGPRPAHPLGNMSHPLKILVVEDEKALAHMIAMVLGGPASKVTTARNGWEALIKIGLAARPFDFVITDHRMPRMTGLELVRRLRGQDFGGQILVLSAHLVDVDIRAYEELNVDMMMSKPFDFAELQQAMAVLNRKASALVAA